MKSKSLMLFILILSMIIGYAASNTSIDIKGITSIRESDEEFKVYIKGFYIDDNSYATSLKRDKLSVSYASKDSSIVQYSIINESTQYDAEIRLVCTPDIDTGGLTLLEAQSQHLIEYTQVGNDTVNCTLVVERISRAGLADKKCEYDIRKSWEFDYTGEEQEFSVPCSGNYKLETWGAQGGSANDTYIGGYGGYSIGKISLEKNNKLYINIGGEGESNGSYADLRGGYNGGGNIASSDVNHEYGAGGGATHIALESGLLSTLENQKEQILIVSGAGGGGRYQPNYDAARGNGGSAGGYIGVSGEQLGSNKTIAYGGTQTSGGVYTYFSGSKLEDYPHMKAQNGSFGLGGSAVGLSSGGGGFYGGASGIGAGAGGSSYIGNPLLTDKTMYCYNCTESNEESTKTISNTCSSNTPTTNCAKQGNGYARITYLGK